MLFNSYEFIFGFLPAVLIGFFLLGRLSRRLAFAWLIVASIVYYAWWRPLNVLIILPSIAVNYAVARMLMRLRESDQSGRKSAWLLAFGILFNVAFLGYFKYANFVTTAVNDATGTSFVLTQIVLPLGISFITFQKIAFLVDVHARRVTSFTLRDFGLFVLFFPQLIAGPIVHFREVMPQFQRLTCRFDRMDVAVGLTLFVIGLFKKVVLADGIAEHVAPLYQSAASGRATLLPSWFAAIGFTLQMYFDFSGYSDMALGLARCFGVRLPPNFDSPLKARNIVDFWLRWHMTLTRFLTAYIYNPLVLWLARRRMQKRLPMLGGRKFNLGAFVQLLAVPTLLTMLVSGIWHGAGYLFIAWGLLHGVYLVINHLWREARRTGFVASERLVRAVSASALPLTLIAVCVAMVLFRSPDWTTAKALLKGMAGLGGIGFPDVIAERLPGGLARFISPTRELSAASLVLLLVWIPALSAIALLLPNSLQILAAYEPALGYKTGARAEFSFERRLRWIPTLPWATIAAALTITAILRLGGKSEFLYWQF
jgi:alginate O-acetyltransferase complex protein AlgI